jgi:hypothetical protein
MSVDYNNSMPPAMAFQLIAAITVYRVQSPEERLSGPGKQGDIGVMGVVLARVIGCFPA